MKLRNQHAGSSSKSENWTGLHAHWTTYWTGLYSANLILNVATFKSERLNVKSIVGINHLDTFNPVNGDVSLH